MVENVVYFLTNICNARCEFCCYKNELGKRKKLLNLSEILKIFDNNIFLKYITITGGEPTLYQEFIMLIESLAYYGNLLEITISTNGSKSKCLYEACKAFLKINKQTMLRIKISLDGPGEIHDRIRGQNGLYNKAIKSLKSLIELSQTNSNIIIYATIAIDNYNIEIIKDFARTIRNEINPNYIETVPIRKKRSNSCKVNFYKRYNEISSYLFEEKIFNNSGDKSKYLEVISKTVQVELNNIRKYRKSSYMCTAASKSLSIMPDGEIYPCEILMEKSNKYCMGNIKEYQYNLIALLQSTKSIPIRAFIKDGCNCDLPCMVRQNIISKEI
jgi:radical SAM protein with 4Fe4S-binding SPASM domain